MEFIKKHGVCDKTEEYVFKTVHKFPSLSFYSCLVLPLYSYTLIFCHSISIKNLKYINILSLLPVLPFQDVHYPIFTFFNFPLC